MNDLDERFGGKCLRRVAAGSRIDHVFSNVVLDHLRDETVQGTATRGCLLKDRGTFIVRVDGTLHRLDLPTHAFETIQKLGFFLGDVSHDLSDSYCIGIQG